jgi:hypothetical protein
MPKLGFNPITVSRPRAREAGGNPKSEPIEAETDVNLFFPHPHFKS